MKVTAVFMKAITTSKVLKASGNVVLEGVLSLSYLVLEGSKGPFVTWKGTEQYKKQDGTTGYSSPIFFKDEVVMKAVQKAILDKYALEGNASSQPSLDSGFTNDEIPF